MFERLNKGDILNKKEEAEFYQVSPKTIQRDIEELRTYLSSLYSEEKVEIVYDLEKQGYILNREEANWLNCQEILGLSKVLLESRAFSKKEIVILINKLILQSPYKLRKKIKEVINNEQFHYNSLKHGELLLDKIWDLSKAIREKNIIKLKYQKLQSKKPVTRELEPLGLMFSEFYFYLIAQFKGGENDYKIPYRLDRIIEYTIMEEKYKIPYTDRFQEGEFRKRVQFMIPGKLIKIQFRYFGGSIEAVLDRLPTARIIEKEKENVYILEAEVYGQGIIMWLLSQGQYIEVLKPDSFRQEITTAINEMAANYQR